MLVCAQPGGREGGLLAGIGVRPVVGTHHVGGVRGVFEGIVIGIRLASFHGLDFGVDCDHRVAESVQFFF